MPAPAHRVTLGMMTKFWDVGAVKTRLGSSIGAGPAARIHRLFVMHLCKSLSSFDGHRVVCLAPESRAGALRQELCRSGLQQDWQIVGQAGGDLGNRMAQWFEATFRDQSRPADRAILIGADCPLISPSLIVEADHQLASHDAVFGPAADGGYYLIGMGASVATNRLRSIFDRIPWSTERVMEITRTRLAAAGLSWHELPQQEDVDTVEDLNRLQAILASEGAWELGRGDASGSPTDLLIAIHDVLADRPGGTSIEG